MEREYAKIYCAVELPAVKFYYSSYISQVGLNAK